MKNNINMKKFLFISLITFVMVLTGCKYEVESIALNTERIMMPKGSSRQLKAEVKPDKAPQDVLWKSSDITVARVASNGGISAVGEGECRIIAYAGDKKAECVVIVFAEQGGDTGHVPIDIPVVKDMKFTVGGVTIELSGVEGGSFLMGGTPEQGSDIDRSEKPVHKVALKDFNIMRTEVTQVLWNAVMESNPSQFVGDSLPVENVNWYDCQNFVDKLNQKLAAQLKGKKFSLPTEAQWEFAARGGNKSKGYKYAGSNNIDEVGWSPDNSGNRVHPVAQKKANELGLYDMSGNVYEWCLDWRCTYLAVDQKDPVFLKEESEYVKISRGGSWFWSTKGCRVSSRGGNDPNRRVNDLGLRLVVQ